VTKTFVAVGVIALAAVIAIIGAEDWYKSWSLNHRPFEPPPRSRPGPAGAGMRELVKQLLEMPDGETSWHHYRDVTRHGNTWKVDGKIFTSQSEAANYL
jgi:hypothetical protein